MASLRVLQKEIWGIVRMNGDPLTVSFGCYIAYYIHMVNKVGNDVMTTVNVTGIFGSVVTQRLVAFTERPAVILDWLKEASEASVATNISISAHQVDTGTTVSRVFLKI
jgi:hypothetical protein